MSISAARFLSYLLHPVLIPFYSILLVLNINTYISFSISPHVQRILFSLVFILTGLLPVLTGMVFLSKGMIRSFEMQDVAERRLPFLTTAVYYMICFYILRQLPVPRLLSLMVLGGAITILIAWVMSYKWKVSIHMIGIGGFTGMLLGFAQVLNSNVTSLIMFAFIISGLLGTARLTLNAHTPPQIYVGFVIGLFTEWFTLTWFLF